MENPDALPKGPRFEDLALPEPIRRAVVDRGYESPTPVQAAVFEPAVSGKDCVVQARTGTGKTAAFGLPLVSRVQSTTTDCQALVLCPTRELALQVSREIQQLAQHTSLNVVTIYGGTPMTRQIEQLQKGAHIIVGTPGRVLDHLRRQTLNVKKLRSFILDECDEMLSMGFLPQINDIWATLPQGHQTLLFSATLPKEVTRIAESRLRSPEFIILSGDQIGALEIQHYFYLSRGNKGQELLQLIEYENPESAILFCNTRDETKRIAKILQDNGYATEWLNADLGQSDRERVMAQIRGGELRFLVCTDVAARGIDISHLTHVVNVDFPDSSEQYVHRTGRTGRAGRIGTAFSLVNPGAIGDLYYLRLKYKIHPIERHLPSKEELLAREEAEILKTLEEQARGRRTTARFTSLARRMLTQDDAVSLVASLLATQLGDGEAIRETAETARKRGVPSRTHANGEAASSTGVSSRSSEMGSRDLPPRLRGPRQDGPRGEQRRSRDAGPREGGARDAGPRQDATPREPSLRDAAPRAEATPREPSLRDATPREPSLRDAGPRQDATPREPSLRDATPRAEAAPRDSAPAFNADRGPRRPRREGARPPSFDEDLGIQYQVSDLPSPEVGEAPARETNGSASADIGSDFVSLFVSVGRRDGARVEDVESALSAAGVDTADTGRISVKLNHTFVEVRPAAQSRVIERLSGQQICGCTAHVEPARAR